MPTRRRQACPPAGASARLAAEIRDAQTVWDAYQLGRADEQAVRDALARAEEVAPREENVAAARFAFEALLRDFGVVALDFGAASGSGTFSSQPRKRPAVPATSTSCSTACPRGT